ncbi:loricrin-like [Coffea eugenioides]|uniref:loricrin-like n=1 Tax=Coffea eugenioides TaxID=49369 RepID=UPI000F5CE397|nr:loricrin-like [Coffea arabica]XP_027157634.1 loricrin-like [Coffea eugenioides]
MASQQFCPTEEPSFSKKKVMRSLMQPSTYVNASWQSAGSWEALGVGGGCLGGREGGSDFGGGASGGCGCLGGGGAGVCGGEDRGGVGDGGCHQGDQGQGQPHAWVALGMQTNIRATNLTLSPSILMVTDEKFRRCAVLKGR